MVAVVCYWTSPTSSALKITFMSKLLAGKDDCLWPEVPKAAYRGCNAFRIEVERKNLTQLRSLFGHFSGHEQV